MRATFVRSTPVSVCSLHDEIRAGDRSIVLVRINEFELSPDGAPLVFHRSGYHTRPITPGPQFIAPLQMRRQS